MAQPRVLVTGFDPFNGESLNPSWLLAERLDGWICEGHEVVARRLPTVFGRSLEALRAAVAETEPCLILSIGQDKDRPELCLERVAINLDDARIPDNEGQQPVDRPIVPGGPAAYFSTLPLKAILAELHAAGFPARMSHSAGTFVCNHVFYGARHLQATECPGLRCGFIHVPLLPSQAARLGSLPSMALETSLEGLRVAVRTSLTVA